MPDTADFFAADGPLARRLEGYAERREQQQLADAIEQAIGNNTSFVCEAGTGTGKTFAYLVPALQSGKKVIISTGTKHLQDQLFHKDLPVVSKALGIPVNTALLKGRANYLCLQRMEAYEKDNRHSGDEIRSELVTLRQWLTGTTSGDLGEAITLPENSPVRAAVTSTAENCLGQACDYYEDCFVLKARRRAADADMVVVNHHLLLADLALRESGFAEVLPTADYIIFDEAHQLPELAAGFFGTSISSRQLLSLINDCRVAAHNDAADARELPALLDTLQNTLKQTRLAFGLQDGRFSWQDIATQAEVPAAMDALLQRLSGLEKLLDGLAAHAKSLENCWQRCSQLLGQIRNYRERQSDDNIQWLELRGQGFLLHQTPLDVSGIFQARLAQHECECIYTSATLAVDDDFSHFSAQLGLLDVPARAWASPFDFRQQALLYLPEDLPEPAAVGYTEAVIEAALPVIEASQGHAFLLFTSHRALRLAADYIRQRIEYPVLVQGNAPRSELLAIFRDTRHAILLGTSSFWEGVDVKGEALSCVIIDKLPFAPPDDPVFRARAARMEAQGLNPFMDYQLPQAVITLKQGVGRLIRDPLDYGVLMICDPRINSKSYGRKFRQSLPPMPQTHDLEVVRSFFRERRAANSGQAV